MKTNLPIASEFISVHVRSLMEEEVKNFAIGIKIDFYRANRILTISCITALTY